MTPSILAAAANYRSVRVVFLAILLLVARQVVKVLQSVAQTRRAIGYENMFAAMGGGDVGPTTPDRVGETAELEPSHVEVERTFDMINPGTDDILVSRRRLGPSSRLMLARIRIRFGTPTHSVANEEMVRRFIYQNADVFRGIRDIHLPKWISTIVVLSFIPLDHEYEMRRVITGNVSYVEQFLNFVLLRETANGRITSFANMMQQ